MNLLWRIKSRIAAQKYRPLKMEFGFAEPFVIFAMPDVILTHILKTVK